MPKKKRPTERDADFATSAPSTLQPITETIEKNYMPYVMTVIKARAIPEIDGLKPSHRKILFTMYKMGLLTGGLTKSANVVGQTMAYNPHGDAAIYETLVRLTRDNGALLHPLLDSKGTFGKHYSLDAYGASRYTDVKLAAICAEVFGGIEQNAVDFVDNYDSTKTEPILLPTAFPNVLVSPNKGIAVGMASDICSFNLAEICDGTIALLKNPHMDADMMLDIVKAPDFSGGGSLLYNREQLLEIYRTGRGGFRLRARYEYDESANCIDITEIPYSTNTDAIISRISELVKEGKIKDIVDFRDETDLRGLKLTIDLRRGVEPDKLMAKLFRMTTLEDKFNCNFNVLIDSNPRVLGVVDLLHEWIRFRMTCLRREMTYGKEQKEKKLHLLMGLGKILLDIDKAIKIVRETPNDREVVPNLMEGFSIDQVQAEYIADIRLRHLNREYILNRIKEIEELQAEIANLADIIGNDSKLKGVIIEQLEKIKKKYAQPRKTMLVFGHEIDIVDEKEEIENYNVRFILTREGYFKKITLQSLRGADEQHLKEGDEIICEYEGENVHELLFFTDAAQCYKAKANDFDPTKASAMGDFIPAKLGLDPGEKVLFMKNVAEFVDTTHMMFFFANGKGVRVPISAYATKTNRKKLTGAYSDASPLVRIFCVSEPMELMLATSDRRGIIIDSTLVAEKATRSAGGVTLITLRKNATLEQVTPAPEGEEYKSLRKSKIPVAGVIIPDYDAGQNQLTIGD
ncbi:MAG: DNA topoisomerase (ATP-hydrolyzing) subunit A [Oscillospiraceae bacterium]|nr:DNA topoisomerase (ATP-hydrolyzing) subunit A [Oscillospiraceae bacterium]